jgi:histidinol dehydrogenase
MLRTLRYDNPDDRRALEALVERLRAQVMDVGQVAEQVATIIDDVRHEGDDAVVKYMRKWTDPAFTASRIRVSRDELAAGEREMEPAVHDALARAIEHVRQYQQHIMPKDPPNVTIDGAELGLRFTPIGRVGLHVPGGKASYPSSVVMLGVPAQVGGVKELSLVSPPPTGGGADVSPLVLGACSMLGIDRVYRIGGAQAIAALALGTESVEPVDFIAGPGNAYTQQAKRQLFGTVGIDGLFGPSEIVVLADGSANPAYIAADLIAQAEHDPGCCFLISTSSDVIDGVTSAVASQIGQRKRRGVIEQALRDWSAAIVVPEEAAACELIDMLAAEHVTLAVDNPVQMMQKLNHGGAWFLGDATPVASGDYYAGPSHCLPTGTTARFTSGLSVYTFLKRSSVERYPAGLGEQAAEDIAAMAEAEGLDGHAQSVRIRRK